MAFAFCFLLNIFFAVFESAAGLATSRGLSGAPFPVSGAAEPVSCDEAGDPVAEGCSGPRPSTDGWAGGVEGLRGGSPAVAPATVAPWEDLSSSPADSSDATDTEDPAFDSCESAAGSDAGSRLFVLWSSVAESG